MTDLQRLAGIVLSPGKTFEDIHQRPSWILPVALLLLFNLLGDFVVFRVLITDANFEQMARTKVQWDASLAGPQKSRGTEAQQIETFRREREYWYLLPLIVIPVTVLAYSIFFYVVLLLAKADAPFAKVLVVVCWAFVIYRCIGKVFAMTALLVHGTANFFPGPEDAWSPTSLAQLIWRSSVSPSVYSSLSKLDIFLVWWLAALAIGFSKISKNLTIGKSAALVIACEVLYLLVNASGLPR
jgi:Yip1-like protein